MEDGRVAKGAGAACVSAGRNTRYGMARAAAANCRQLIRLPGVSFKVKLCVGHQITEARDPDMPAIFIDDFG